jgi:uncharacterized protein with NRDE domain
MCTAYITHRTNQALLVAFNRDEEFNRLFISPTIKEHGTILSPTDLRGGGSWLSVNNHGMVVGLTNIDGQTIEGMESRGKIVNHLAKFEDPNTALLEFVNNIDVRKYNSFHLFLANKDYLFVINSDSASYHSKKKNFEIENCSGRTIILTNTLRYTDCARALAVDSFMRYGKEIPAKDKLNELLDLEGVYRNANGRLGSWGTTSSSIIELTKDNWIWEHRKRKNVNSKHRKGEYLIHSLPVY